MTNDSLLQVLTSGGDERIAIDPVTGANRYYMDPTRFHGLLQRGSCTVGTLNERSHEVATRFLERYDSLDYDELVAAQATRLRVLARVTEERPVDVFFAPSGTDLAYYPLIFESMLRPSAPILHMISCPEELGSGSAMAGSARYFSRRNQFGDPLIAGDPVCAGIDPKVEMFGARNADGEILERREAIDALVRANPGAAIVGSLVFGSKSGIADDLDVIDDHVDDVLWVVDLCQFRVDPELIHRLLDKGATVMLTGSKFFEAPPFAAALLVPASLTDRLVQCDAEHLAGFSSLFSASDVPPRLTTLRSLLDPRENRGLRLRWEIALDEMEAYVQWPNEETVAMIATWNAVVTDALSTSGTFALMPDQRRTNPSIISFQVRSQAGELDHDALVRLHRGVVTTEHQGLSGDLRRVFFGQPVRYGDRSFVRLALGAPTVRRFLEHGTDDFADDLRLIEIIADAVEGAAR